VNNPKGAKSLIIGAAVLLVVCVIGYAASSGEITNHFLKYGVSTSNESKMIDMGIYLTGFLSIVSVVAILVSEGIGLFKN
jgi:multisubunit Na+/H+ antiporter MnhB subunit